MSTEGTDNTTDGQAGQGQLFSIQPHPSKTNDPADLQKPSGGLSSVFNTPGLVIPSNGLPEPLSREELRAAQAQLNQAQLNLNTPGLVISSDDLPEPLSPEFQAAQAQLSLKQ